MEYWTAFTLGLVGGIHCIGMCGPIAVSLPVKASTRFHTIKNILLYNFGRVVTYSFMGAILGLIGLGALMAGFQKTLSIVLGIAILAAVLFSIKFKNRLFSIPIIKKAFDSLKSRLSILLQKHSTGSLFTIGLLNGFLPCGMVYIALAGALVAGSIQGGILYMALFGIGTIPLMFMASFAGNYLGLRFRKNLRKLVPAFMVILALMLIFRGMADMAT